MFDPTAEARLTERQRAFAAAFLAAGAPTYLHATRSAATAGYRWPDKQGSRLLTMPHVRALVEAQFQEQLRAVRQPKPPARPVRRWRRKGTECM